MEPKDRIKLARLDRKLTQKQLADRLGISVQAVSQWETGRTEPSLDNYDRLSDVLRADFGWLRGIEDHKGDSQAIVKSRQFEKFGDRSPIIDIRSALYFARGNLDARVDEIEDKGSVLPTINPVGKSFCILLEEKKYEEALFAQHDILIFDNGIKELVSDVVLSAIMIPDFKLEVILSRVVSDGVNADGSNDLNIRPLSPHGLRAHSHLKTIFIPVIAVMVEHRRLRDLSRDT